MHKTNTLIFSYGRFQPPTSGHSLLINKVKDLAKEYGADYTIYVSHTVGKTPKTRERDPIPQNIKLHYLNMMFPDTNFIAADCSPVDELILINKRYDNVILVGGEDRRKLYTEIIPNLNGKDYNYKDMSFVSSGDRGEDAISGTAVRRFAQVGDFENFKKSIGGSLSDHDARRLMDFIIYDPHKEKIST